jgi:hypothetical protein
MVSQSSGDIRGTLYPTVTNLAGKTFSLVDVPAMQFLIIDD